MKADGGISFPVRSPSSPRGRAVIDVGVGKLLIMVDKSASSRRGSADGYWCFYVSKFSAPSKDNFGYLLKNA